MSTSHYITWWNLENLFDIETFDGMTSGRYNTPVRFGRPSSKSTFNKEGFSDHLSVSFIVEEKL